MAKLLLKLLIGVIDTKLFETIKLESLETVDVENAYEAVGFCRRFERLVDLTHEVEELRVHVFGQRVSRKQRLFKKTQNYLNNSRNLTRRISISNISIKKPTYECLNDLVAIYV